MVRFEYLNIETIDVEQGIRQTLDKELLDELPYDEAPVPVDRGGMRLGS